MDQSMTCGLLICPTALTLCRKSETASLFACCNLCCTQKCCCTPLLAVIVTVICLLIPSSLLLYSNDIHSGLALAGLAGTVIYAHMCVQCMHWLGKSCVNIHLQCQQSSAISMIRLHVTQLMQCQ